MKVPQSLLTRSVIALLAFALCGVCESAVAFAQAPQQTQQPIAGAPAQQQTSPGTTTAPAGETAPTASQPNAQQPGTAQPTTVQDVPPATSQQSAPPSGSTVDPSQGPLNPVPAQSVPEAPSATQPPAQQPQTQPTGQPGTQQQQTQREPLGAAAAEGIRTAGGGASRPAGSAIAPAKQHQVRSFLIKLGAVAAAGVAIGTVYALSRGTSSTPPNTATGTPAVR